MNDSYIAYFDVLAVGDAGRATDHDQYGEMLENFRTALCEATLHILKPEKGDVVYAYSDCAFAQSFDINRLSSFVSRLQHELWDHPIFIKGAISVGHLTPVKFGAKRGYSKEGETKLSAGIKGYWFGKDAVAPAEAEKSLRGIAVQICENSNETRSFGATWIEERTVATAYYPSEASKRPLYIRGLRIPAEHLPALKTILERYLLECQSSRRTGRYYLPLIVTWIKSHDFSTIKCNGASVDWDRLPEPLALLIKNKPIRTEILGHFGAELIYYALLDKVEAECDSPVIRDAVYRIMGDSKRLVAAHDLVPNEVCELRHRKNLLEKRVQNLFKSI